MTESDSPGSSKSEHEDLREILWRAEEAGGRTGAAAVEVMKVLFPHMFLSPAAILVGESIALRLGRE